MDARVSHSLSTPARPKVHRLPALPAQKKPFYAGMLRARGALLIAVILLGALCAGGPLLKQSFSAVFQRNSPSIAAANDGKTIKLADAGRLAKNREKTIVIEGASEKIIGQMAKFPVQNEQITEVNATSRVDNTAGRELLSIISKY